MGLCKCPKRKVTNQFCYEHRVNVCEYCVVAHHPKCVVQSYLLWLQDSDYDSTCLICKENLSSDDCIRFLCYHVFHWACIDKYIRSLPETTAPAGYKCPTCKEPILPKQNVLSPVADALREKISSVNWARSSLGLPMLTEEKFKNPGKNIQPLSTEKNNGSFEKQNQNGSTVDEIIHVEDALYSRSDKSAQVPRRNLHTESEKVLFVEEDESKYRRRYPLPAISNWLKFVGSELIMLKNGPRRKCKIIILIILVFCLLCYILSIWGSMVTSDSPSLDPHNNPFVRVQEEKL